MTDRRASPALPESARLQLPPLAQLLAAHDYACELKKDRWQFAVEAQSLRAAGLTNSDLRWLVCQGYVDHGVEETHSDDGERTFRVAPNLALAPRSCFVLTGAGVKLLRADGPKGSGDLSLRAPRFVGKRDQRGQVPPRAHSPPSPVPRRRRRGEAQVASPPPAGVTEKPTSPHWNEQHRTLYWSGQPVKHYRYDAPNQELILKLFQSHGWVRSVEVALPEDGGGGNKERLRDTIKNLNRSVRPVLHFRQAGTQVSWELSAQSVAQATI